MTRSNRNLMASFSLACLAALSMVPAAQAQTATPHVDQRQAHQAARIGQGVASGELTRHETARLAHGQAHVQRIENHAKADGVVTRQERARLHHAQNVQSQRIHRQKHNRLHDRNHDGRPDARTL